MQHQQGFIFDLYPATLYPSGYGKDTTPFETGEIRVANGVVEFVVEDGEVAVFGGEWFRGAVDRVGAHVWGCEGSC